MLDERRAATMKCHFQLTPLVDPAVRAVYVIYVNMKSTDPGGGPRNRLLDLFLHVLHKRVGEVYVQSAYV